MMDKKITVVPLAFLSFHGISSSSPSMVFLPDAHAHKPGNGPATAMPLMAASPGQPHPTTPPDPDRACSTAATPHHVAASRASRRPRMDVVSRRLRAPASASRWPRALTATAAPRQQWRQHAHAAIAAVPMARVAQQPSSRVWANLASVHNGPVS